MKKLLLILHATLLMTLATQAKMPDTPAVKEVPVMKIEKNEKAIDQATTATAKLDSTIKKLNPAPTVLLAKPMANLLTLLPVIFYLITLLVVTGKLKREGVKLSWFLLDKELIAQLGKQTAQVETARMNAIAKAPTPEAARALADLPAYAFSPNQTADDTPPPPEEGKESVSRLIALLSGLVTLGLASCLTSFYIYKSFIGHPDVDLGKIATVLYGLGLGLVPYGFTKVAGVLKG